MWPLWPDRPLLVDLLPVKFVFDRTEIAVTHADRASLLAGVRDSFAAGRGFALATINLDHIVKLGRDPVFRAAYARQDMVVADGNPVVWLSRLAGSPVSLVPGSELVLPLSAEAVAAGVSVALVGSTEAALQGAADHLRRNVPGVEIAAMIAPPFGFDPAGPQAAEVLAQVRDSGARLCFLALGAPKQEELAARGRDIAPGVGFASVGAGLDFLAGRQTRAPLWVRRLALEWLWRALSSPRRLIPRYAACFAILPGQIVQALRQRG